MLKPQLVFMEVNMSGMGGIEATMALLEVNPDNPSICAVRRVESTTSKGNSISLEALVAK